MAGGRRGRAKGRPNTLWRCRSGSWRHAVRSGKRGTDPTYTYACTYTDTYTYTDTDTCTCTCSYTGSSSSTHTGASSGGGIRTWRRAISIVGLRTWEKHIAGALVGGQAVGAVLRHHVSPPVPSFVYMSHGVLPTLFRLRRLGQRL